VPFALFLFFVVLSYTHATHTHTTHTHTTHTQNTHTRARTQGMSSTAHAGTQPWQGPEIIDHPNTGSAPYSVKSDVFSCALVIFSALTQGRHPFLLDTGP
jgi:serine/threonine protein kinase